MTLARDRGMSIRNMSTLARDRGSIFDLRKSLVVCLTRERVWSCVRPEKEFGLLSTLGS